MKIFGRIINPLMAFIGIQLVWVVVLVFWISWFMRSHRKLRSLAEKYSPELLQAGTDWFILVEGIVLLAAILIGVYVIFLYWQRQHALYHAQHQFVAQVTHELKSPLASLQLHLETIRRRQPGAEKLADFVNTMLSDTRRLDMLTSNLLTANRLGHKGFKLSLHPGNLSELAENYFRDLRFSLPRAGRMELDIAPDLIVRLDGDSLETVFRNLLENSLLYSDGPPQITVSLRADGRYAHLTFSDQGRGMEAADQKKVFQMFYRVRIPGKTIRGSGLGLFIVRGVIKLHKGRVWIESPGLGAGTAVHILLPLVPTRTNGGEA
jgi:signal transduction histidine kinase